MIPGASLGTRLIGAARGHAVSSAIVFGSLFVAQIAVGRRFGGTGLGEYTATSIAVYLTMIVSCLAVPLTVSREIGRGHELGTGDRSASRDGFTVIGAFSLVGGLALAALWDPIAAGFVKEPPAPQILVTATIAGALGLYANQVLQAQLRLLAASTVVLAQPVVVIAAVLADRYTPVRPSEVAALGYVAAGLAGVFALLLSGIRPRAHVAGSVELIRRSLGLIPAMYTNVMSALTDRLVVAVVLGPIALGAYQAASALVEGLLRPLRTAGPVALSAYGRATAVQDGRAIRLRRIHVSVWALYAAIAASALIAGAGGLVTSLYGPGFASAENLLQILAAAMLPTAVALALLVAGAGAGRREALAIARVAIPFQLLVSVGLASLVGLPGVALAQILVTVPVAVFQLQQSGDPELHLPNAAALRLGAIAVLAPVMALAVALLPLPWPIRSAVAAIATAALGIPLLFRGEDQKVIRRLIAF